MASVTSVWWYANYRLMQETSMNEETLEGFCIDYENIKVFDNSKNSQLLVITGCSLNNKI